MNKEFTRMQQLAGVITENYVVRSEGPMDDSFHSNIMSAWDTEEKIIADLKKFMSKALEIGGEDLVMAIKSAVNSSMSEAEKEEETEGMHMTELAKGKMTKDEFKKKLKEAILAELDTTAGIDAYDEMGSLDEAKKKEEEEEDIDIESDVEGDVENLDLDITGGEEGSQIDMNMDTTGDIDAGSSESKKAFSELTDAYRAAKELGDEKLIRQIANTITYFNKNIILSQG
jgi:phage-related tail fiber protein